MTKRKHHFVPLFYLRAFQSEERRVHLYNLDSSFCVPNTSLKNQCYSKRFHGTDDKIEDQLAIIESFVAPVIRAVTSMGSLPEVDSDELELLYIFAAMQLVRVPKIAGQINLFVDKMTKQTYSGARSIEGLDLEKETIGFVDPVLVTLRFFPDVLFAISDLKPHLLVSSRNVFLTSDNPVVKYNQYYEGVDYAGVTGATSKGLQIFIPLSPRHHLILYDGTTYRAVAGQFSQKSGAIQSDIDTLNKMQLISADSHIYFSDWRQIDDIDRLLPEISERRKVDRTVVAEFGQDDNPRSSIIHAYEVMEDISLNLTFLAIKGEARKVKRANRTLQYRDQPYRVPPSSNTSPSYRNDTRTYSRFIGKR